MDLSISESILKNSDMPYACDLSEVLIKELDKQIRDEINLDYKTMINLKKTGEYIYSYTSRKIKDFLENHGYTFCEMSEYHMLIVTYDKRDFKCVINPFIITAEEAYNKTLKRYKYEQNRRIEKFKIVLQSPPVKVLIQGDHKLCYYGKPDIENLECLIKNILIPHLEYKIEENYLIILIKK